MRARHRNCSHAILRLVELAAAIAKAYEILGEEVVRPTVGYREVLSDNWSVRLIQATASVNSNSPIKDQHLQAQRRYRPRPVHENPERYVFESLNYNLLVALYSQVVQTEREAFTTALLDMLPRGHSRGTQFARFPTFDQRTSSFPLLAEFCIRTRNTDQLFRAIEKTKKLIPSLIILLMQIEEIVSLNFTEFSYGQLQILTISLTPLDEIVREILGTHKESAKVSIKPRPISPPGQIKLAREAQKILSGIREECSHARYWYLKGELQQTESLEITQDKATVSGYLASLGFSDAMAKILDTAEAEYRSASTAFDLKNCMGLLRSFLEHLHREAVQAIGTSMGTAVVDKWGNATKFLRDNGFITQQEEAFATSLYTVASDESVHPLIAEREYARLFRTVVIEYGVLFLTVLDKKGVRLKALTVPSNIETSL